jgi:hypothetical protein
MPIDTAFVPSPMLISTVALEPRKEMKYISDQVDILNRWLDEID